MDSIYHVITREEWERARTAGIYRAPSLATVGFIHFCLASQLDFVRRKYFATQGDLLLLEVDPARLQCEVRYEKSEPDQEPFPHLYGPMELEAVIGATAMT